MTKEDKIVLDVLESTSDTKSIDRLTQENIKLESQRNAVCFIALLIVFFIIDIIAFEKYNNWGAPVAILILELVIAFIVGVYLEIDSFTNLMVGILNSINFKSNK